MKPSRRLLVQGCILVLILVIVGTIGLVSRRFSPPFDLALLDQLRHGMSEDEVQAILGPPNRKLRYTWIYVRPGSWPRVTVEFSGDRTYFRSGYQFF